MGKSQKSFRVYIWLYRLFCLDERQIHKLFGRFEEIMSWLNSQRNIDGKHSSDKWQIHQNSSIFNILAISTVNLFNSHIYHDAYQISLITLALLTIRFDLLAWHWVLYELFLWHRYITIMTPTWPCISAALISLQFDCVKMHWYLSVPYWYAFR